MAKMLIDDSSPTQQIKWSLVQGIDSVQLVGHDGKKSKTVIEIRDDGKAYLIGYAELDGLRTDEEGCIVTIVDG